MKIHMVSLAFVPARIAIECMRQVRKTIGNVEYQHHVLMQHYPIDETVNDRLLSELFKLYNCKIHDLGENVGLSAGYNYLINSLNLTEGDIVIGLDLDVNPVTPGWGEALVKVMRADPTLGWVSLMNQHAERELPERGFTTHTIGGTVCYEGSQACVQSIVGWSAKSLLGLVELKETSKWYGGMESVSFPRLKALGLRWVYLPQYREEFTPLMEADGPYRHYKWNLAHLKTTTLDFASWLKEDPSRMDLK